MANVLAVGEQRDGELRKVSREVVTAAALVSESLGGEVHALVLGPQGTSEAAAELGRFGADRVLVGESEALGLYDPGAYTTAVVELVRERDYTVVLFPASALGKDLAPRVAARLDRPLATEATALEVADGRLVITRPVYAGKVVARVAIQGDPQLVSLRPNVFTPAERSAAGQLEPIEPPAPDQGTGVRVREVVAAEGARLDVSEAPIVISGGRGLRGPEHWGVLEQLRDALGSNAALGASRAVVDAGWRPHGEQVGQTGKTVSPQLYFAVGISGAIQHLAGMRTARVIVAINKDPDAPIFKIADYGIVGDAFEVVPTLADAIRKARAGGS